MICEDYCAELMVDCGDYDGFDGGKFWQENLLWWLVVEKSSYLTGKSGYSGPNQLVTTVCGDALIPYQEIKREHI